MHDVATLLPSQVMGELMGLPREDWHQIHRWAEMNTSGQDPDIVGAEHAGTDPDSAYETSGAGTTHMAMYAMQFAAQRRTEAPREDLTSLILAGNFGDGPMTDVDFGSFFVQLVTAGNDTTKTMLVVRPARAAAAPGAAGRGARRPVAAPGRGRGDPALREPAALLPAHRHRRHRAARHDDRRGRQGAHVLHVGEPRRGRLRRPAPLRHPPLAEPAPLVRHRRSTSASASTWPGSRARCSSRRCSSTFPTIELTGEPVRVRSNLNNGYKRMPVRLSS